MSDPVYPADVAGDLDAASLTYDIKLPWLFQGVGRCRSCGAPIAWAQHEHTGRRAPFNPDGTSHFSDCPQANEWRRRPVGPSGKSAQGG